MSKLINILSKAISDISTSFLFESDIKEKLKELDECNIKIYREDKTQPLPIYSKENDACMDIYATKIEYDSNNDKYIVYTGLHFELPEDYEMEIRPRSSNTKTEYYMPNSPGTLDAGYRGELLIIFKNRISNDVINCIGYFGEALNSIVKINNFDAYEAVTKAHDIYKNIVNNNKFPYKVGDRICQILIRRREKIKLHEVESLDDLSKTDRGDKGFGSTGK